MNLQHRWQRSFKPRFAVVYPFGIFVLFYATLDHSSLRQGIGFILAGLLIRLWSNGYAIKNDKLTTSGPYAFVRNPLYLGTFLIALGFVLALHMSWMGLLFLAAMALMYYKTINDEQSMLSKKFGKVYQDYCAKVPALMPSLKPYSEGEKWPFNLDRLMRSKEYKSIVWVTVLLIAFYLLPSGFIAVHPTSPKEPIPHLK